MSAAHEHEHRAISRAFAIAVGLNLVYVIAEFGFGLLADSVALLADAAHNLGDVLGLVLAWGAARLAQRAPEGRRTYGLRKSTVLAALANALLLIAAVGGVVWEAIGRLQDPPAPAAGMMMIVASVGVVINGVCAWILMRSGHGHGHDHGHDHGRHDLNLRGAVLHLAADAAVSVGVVITGALLLWTGWRWLDPAVSLLIAVVIFVGTWSLLREALDLALDAAPKHIDVEGVRSFLSAQPGVLEVHDLHVWALGTRDVALTAHLVVEAFDPTITAVAERELAGQFGIVHTTLQLEEQGDAHCPQRC
jgi:cobalt-zinc-cadmium efflux system protein